MPSQQVLLNGFFSQAALGDGPGALLKLGLNCLIWDSQLASMTWLVRARYTVASGSTYSQVLDCHLALEQTEQRQCGCW